MVSKGSRVTHRLLALKRSELDEAIETCLPTFNSTDKAWPQGEHALRKRVSESLAILQTNRSGFLLVAPFQLPLLRSDWTDLAESGNQASDEDLIIGAVRCAAEVDRKIIWLNKQKNSTMLLFALYFRK